MVNERADHSVFLKPGPMDIYPRSRDRDPWYLGKPNDIHGWISGLYWVPVRNLRVSGAPQPSRGRPPILNFLLQSQSRSLCLGPEVRVFIDGAG